MIVVSAFKTVQILVFQSRRACQTRGMLALFAAAALLPRFDVTFDSLVRDMYSLDTLCEYPDPPYETRQSSSYDRASVAPGNDAWFANKDWGNFLRDEERNGRNEHVMADVKGPGVMVRYWSPNPAGVTRIYVDGSDAPLIEAPSAELLGGKSKLFAPPVSQETSAGWSLYCPIPFQKSLRVTVDDSDKDAGGRMYYQIQCRKYAEGVTVEPFSTSTVASAELARKLSMIPALPMLGREDVEVQNTPPGGTMKVARTGKGVVRNLIVMLPPNGGKTWQDPATWQNVLRSVQVRATFDGEPCIDAPLGDLMSTSVGVNRLTTPAAIVSENGVLVLNLPMPYKESARFEFVNNGKASVELRVAAITGDYTWTDRSMHFKAQWTCYQGGTRPMRDLGFLQTQGAGVFVGCNVAISNPVSGWWGEGDEKIYLDGEKFPSTFGTGTEDYFGYGWSNPALFQHPYHYQSRCDGPGTKGHSCIGRWQFIDRFPFTSSFQFDMELWHWVDCQMMYGRTVFWYSKPGTPGPHSDVGANFMLPFIEGAKRIPGAVEGEEAKIIVKTGGETELQGFDNLSNGKQLWWRDAKVGDSIQLSIPVPQNGRYHVFGRFCFATDYGVHRIKFGSIEKDVDFYDKLGWKTVDLGVTNLGSGDVALTMQVIGANPKADPHHMFGLDYLLLVKE